MKNKTTKRKTTGKGLKEKETKPAYDEDPDYVEKQRQMMKEREVMMKESLKQFNSLKKNKDFVAAKKALQNCGVANCNLNIKQMQHDVKDFPALKKKTCGKLNLNARDLKAEAMRFQSCQSKLQDTSPIYKRMTSLMNCGREKCLADLNHYNDVVRIGVLKAAKAGAVTRRKKVLKKST